MSDIKFNFNKKDEKPVGNQTELEELTDVKATEAPIDMPELTDNASEVQENNTETEAEQTVTKAVVEYIGNGVWKDSKGKCWARNTNKGADILSTRVYNISEYEDREDLQFMVGYGEMKLSLV